MAAKADILLVLSAMAHLPNIGCKGNNINFITFTLARVDELVKIGINIG